jgi:hypothetical protein
MYCQLAPTIESGKVWKKTYLTVRYATTMHPVSNALRLLCFRRATTPSRRPPLMMKTLTWLVRALLSEPR